jgi:selenophosphate synthase
MNYKREHFLREWSSDRGARRSLAGHLFDPQTSGGLLISVAAKRRTSDWRTSQKAGIQAVLVGSVEDASGKRLKIR